MKVTVRRFKGSGTKQEFTGESSFEKSEVSVGRGADADINIADLRVPINYASVLFNASTRSWQIHAKAQLGIKFNGIPQASAKLKTGDLLSIGRFTLFVLKADKSGDLTLELREDLTERDLKNAQRKAHKTTLEQTLPNKRLFSWVVFLLVLIPLFAIPYMKRFVPESEKLGLSDPRLPDDTVWVTGHISSAHSNFGDDCGQCHVKPFQRVQNSACIECHEDTKHHVSNDIWLAQSEFASQRCASCHQEHNGRDGLVLQHPAQCTDCHANIQEKFAASEQESVGDFLTAHPDFAPSIPIQSSSGSQFQRMRQSSIPLTEQSNLIYPHDVHLAPEGIDSPNGSIVMQCADCHQSDTAGGHFLPIKMEEHCSACHRLDFDPDDPNRELPHARLDTIEVTLDEYYARRALLPPPDKSQSLQRRPTPRIETEAQKKAALKWADERSQKAFSDLLDRRACSYCHVITESTENSYPWDVVTPKLQTDFMPASSFDHHAHRSEPCTLCHAADTSNQSSDVLLPEIKTCRTCHGGAQSGVIVGSKMLIPSTCIDCHSYHYPENPQMGESQK